MQLYHVTTTKCWEDIQNSGSMRPMSYWTTSEEVLDYYREEVAEEGTPITLVVEIEHIEDLDLEPDYPGIDEPITSALGRKEEEVWAAWEAAPVATWQESLRVVHSLRARAAVPVSVIGVRDKPEPGFHRL